MCKYTLVAWKHRKYFRLQFIDRHHKGREARLRVLDIYWTERNMMFFAKIYPLHDFDKILPVSVDEGL